MGAIGLVRINVGLVAGEQKAADIILAEMRKVLRHAHVGQGFVTNAWTK